MRVLKRLSKQAEKVAKRRGVYVRPEKPCMVNYKRNL